MTPVSSKEPTRRRPPRSGPGACSVLPALFALALPWTAGCRGETLDEVEVSFSHRTQTANEDQGERLQFAVAAMLAPRETASQYARIVEELGRVLGQPIQLVHGRSYAHVNDLLQSGKLQMAFLCTGGYLELLDRAPGTEVLAVPRVGGKLTYRSYVIVAADGPARAFSDLEGKRFAFTDPLSNTGYLYPTSLLRALGKDRDHFFSSYIFTGSHDRAIVAVQRGIRDAAAVDSLVYEYLAQHHPKVVKGLRILVRSPEYGIPPVVAGPGTSPAQRRRWREALLGLHRRPTLAPALAQLRIERFSLPPAGLYRTAAELWRAAR